MDAAMTQRIVLEMPGADPVLAEITDEDARTLRDLLRGVEARAVAVTAREAPDTEGHAALAADTMGLDVEGHAITVRLPRPDDVELLRRRIVAGVAVTLIAGGAAVAAGLGGTPDARPSTTTVPGPAIRAAPEPAPPPTRQELLIRINEPRGSDVLVPIRGDEAAPPPLPRPGERPKPF